MATIELHHFIYAPDNPIPYYMGRLEELPAAARATYPNRHTFYEVFWITQGAGLHHIDFHAYPILPQSLYFIAPGQIHFWEIEGDIRGYAILFPPAFFQLTAPTFLDELTLFHVGESPPALSLTGSAAAEVNLVVERLLHEYLEIQFSQLTALQAWMQLLLIQAQRGLMATQPFHPTTAAALLTRQFLRLLDQHYITTHGVHPYADMLGVTAGHLTESVKEVMGVPAGTLIRRRLALEAQRFLAHSEHTVAEIAEVLHFEDPSYFARFFKREIGQSPVAFRDQFRKKYQTSQDR